MVPLTNLGRSKNWVNLSNNYYFGRAYARSISLCRDRRR